MGVPKSRLSCVCASLKSITLEINILGNPKSLYLKNTFSPVPLSKSQEGRGVPLLPFSGLASLQMVTCKTTCTHKR